MNGNWRYIAPNGETCRCRGHWAQLRIAIAPDDIAITLHHKCAMPRASYWNRHYPPLNTVISGNRPARKRSHLFWSQNAGCSFLEWHKPASVLHNMVRAVAIRGRVPSAMLAIRNSPSGRACSSSCQQSTAGERDFCCATLIACGDGALEIVTGQAGDGILCRARN